jgi:hypothetical protein
VTFFFTEAAYWVVFGSRTLNNLQRTRVVGDMRKMLGPTASPALQRAVIPTDVIGCKVRCSFAAPVASRQPVCM